MKVWLGANTFGYAEGGGHAWAYLNWALGLRALGCDVVWLEGVHGDTRPDLVREQLGALRRNLEPYGLAGSIALWSPAGREADGADVPLDAAGEADLLLSLRYDLPDELVRRFRRSALVDIDPGLLQLWMTDGSIRVVEFDVHFTTGRRVGAPGSAIPDAGRPWLPTRPCVALDAWPVAAALNGGAAFTTVSQWSAEEEWVGDAENGYRNDKRAGFVPFLDLPSRTSLPLELALSLGDDEAHEREELLRRGWHVRSAREVSATPWAYQRYIQSSLAEFSCAKPSCVRLQNGWVSDRTLCYLASGKPAVVQHTGRTELLPDGGGVFRFRTLDEAAEAIDSVAADHARQSALARSLAEEHFDARAVVASVLARAL